MIKLNPPIAPIIVHVDMSIPVDSLELAKTFYGEVLGLEIVKT